MSRPPVRRADARATVRPTATAVRVLACALAALGATALAPPAARAQPATVTFDGLTDVDGSGVRNVRNCYQEGGLRFTLVDLACGTEAAFATWTSDSPLFYTGSPALFNNLGPSVDFTGTGGRHFSLYSIGLAPGLGSFGNPATVSFTGFRVGGGMVTQMFDVMGATGAMSTVQLSGFTNLRSVRMTVTSPDFEPYVQFDDVAASVVPEPATLALVGAGALGLAAAARRRRG